MSASFIDLPGGRHIAYHLSEGRDPTVVFLGGFRSDMTGSKAIAVEEFCKKRGQRFLRFDYTAHGQSSGDFMNSTIGTWQQDAQYMLEHVVKGPCILVGSSMGGWIMLLAALARKAQVLGLVGIASAPDFTKDLIEQEMNDAQREEMARQGVVYVPSCYGEEPYPITRKLIEDGQKHLLMHKEIELDIPVRLLHGMLDRDVPWQVSQRLLGRLSGNDVTLQLFKSAGHRLSEPDQLMALTHAVEQVLTKL